MGKHKKNKIGVEAERDASEDQITKTGIKKILVTQFCKGIITDTGTIGNEIIEKHACKKKAKSIEVIPEDEKYDPQELDAFCDDLDEESNSTFNNWVRLLECQLSGKNMKHYRHTIEQSEDPETVSNTKTQMKKDKNNKQSAVNLVQSQTSKASFKRRNIGDVKVDLELAEMSSVVEPKNKQKKNKQKQDGPTIINSKMQNLDSQPKKKRTKFM